MTHGFRMALAMTAAATALAATPAAAGITGKIHKDGVTHEEVAAWLRAHGQTAEVKPTDDGKGKRVSSAIGGVNYDIFFYKCVAARCASLSFTAGWTPEPEITLAELNNWNMNKRYTFAYRKDNGDLWVEYDIDVAPGADWQLFAQQFDVWKTLGPQFGQFMASRGEVPE